MKSRKITIEQYKEKYCVDKIIRNRKALYVSEEVHTAVNNVVRLFKYDHATAASLVTTILKEHFDTYKDIINAEGRRQNEEFLNWVPDPDKKSE